MIADQLPKLTAPTSRISRWYEKQTSTKMTSANWYEIRRSEFGRDRDRILHSRPFRRLAGKTQIFLSSSQDYVRTRLTHTLEVAHIARDLAQHLNLDHDLAETIALGHDLGHTPFGHVGERTLNYIMNGCYRIASWQMRLSPANKGFKHNLQSCRVACQLCRLYSDAGGLGLTNFTLWGMLSHSSNTWVRRDNKGARKPCPLLDSDGICHLQLSEKRCINEGRLSVGFYRCDKCERLLTDNGKVAWSFEAYVVRLADEIAQRHHDLEDALITRIMSSEEAIEVLHGCFADYQGKSAYRLDTEYYHEMARRSVKPLLAGDESEFIPFVSRFALNFLKKQAIRGSYRGLRAFCKQFDIKSQRDFEAVYGSIEVEYAGPVIGFTNRFAEKDRRLQDTLRQRVLNSSQVQRMDGVGTYIIRNLFDAFVSNPQQLPDKTLVYLSKHMVPHLSSKEQSEIKSEILLRSVGKLRDRIRSWHQSSSDGRFQMALLRVICDHVAGMTDRYALTEYQQLYGNTPLAL